MGKGVRRFTSLRAWQACDAFKKAVYSLCEESPLADDCRRRGQLEKAASGPPAHVAEGFGRFNPPDSARFAVIARSSLMEAQNHLMDAVDRGYISEERRVSVNALAEAALQQVTGWLEIRNPEPRTTNPEPRTPNPEPRMEPEPEPRTANLEA